ncbi:SICA antigen [Plasmodium coatneyi]|uniref:SICA antigen n=1 Tax=Plasmodium coatneyi TaxID=208452 RepID=A0A1B1DUI4_9APIC|nr:SICA antigen [Plasmodium coatneyi]ANQ06309.1 SICA antigen [Plasmodium coatneyi]
MDKLPSDDKFQALKERWFREGGPNRKKRNLGDFAKTVKDLIDEMLKEMSMKAEEDTGIDLCDMIGKETRKEMTQKEKEECAFIVNSLMKMKEMDKGKCRKGEIDEEMKAYVRCAVLNMWLHKYQNVHCGANAVIKNAFGAMGEGHKPFSGEGMCEECRPTFMEPMMIIKGGMPMLRYIQLAMDRNEDIMQIIKSREPKGECKGENKHSGSVVSLPDNSTIISLVRRMAPGMMQGPKAAKTASTGQHEFLMKLLLSWLWARGDGWNEPLHVSYFKYKRL